MMDNVVRIYCDGGSRNNGKENSIGGWGTYFTFNEHTRQLYGGEKLATNNMMEITAVIEGLKQLKTFDLPIEIILDSGYVRNCLKDKWYEKWEKNGWKTSKKEPVENQGLWEELIILIRKCKKVEFLQIKGHLNLNKDSEIQKYHKKFIEQNNKPTTRGEFETYVMGNNIADVLANRGMDNLEV